MTELRQRIKRTVAGNNGMARVTLVVVLLLAGMLLGAPSLRADSFSLTVDHCGGGCGAPPFGTVTVTQNGANVDISVSLTGSNQFVLTGAGDNQFFKFNGAPSLASITVNQSVPGVTLIADTGTFNGDGTGLFNFGVTCTPIAPSTSCATGGGNGLPVGTVLTFHVAGTTVAALTGPNNLGFVFAADILSGTTGNTGPVAAGPNTPTVPEPSSILLLGCGLVGIAAAARRSRIKE